MKEIQYQKFSWQRHSKSWRTRMPNVCQFELTFKCGLHCSHCYSDCYNKSELIKKELSTGQVKFILDKVYKSGVLWLCFTGGDPLTRPDFLEIYSYAKDRGFIITIFTNGYSMTEQIANYLIKRPPFLIEITLNAVNKNKFEEISQVNASFEMAMSGLNIILDKKLPLKIKTMATRQNLEELPKIKNFVEGLDMEFRFDYNLHARLNGDLAPCNLRILPKEVIGLNMWLSSRAENDKNERLSAIDFQCENVKPKAPSNRYQKLNSPRLIPDTDLFRCAASGGDGVHIDPYGNMFMCNCIRMPVINLLEDRIENGLDIFGKIASVKFKTNSDCRYCEIRELCYLCPGRALLEVGDMEASVFYYCELARAMYKMASASCSTLSSCALKRHKDDKIA